jgi:hypothetical protein
VLRYTRLAPVCLQVVRINSLSGHPTWRIFTSTWILLTFRMKSLSGLQVDHGHCKRMKRMAQMRQRLLTPLPRTPQTHLLQKPLVVFPSLGLFRLPWPYMARLLLRNSPLHLSRSCMPLRLVLGRIPHPQQIRLHLKSTILDSSLLESSGLLLLLRSMHSWDLKPARFEDGSLSRTSRQGWIFLECLPIFYYIVSFFQSIVVSNGK